MVFARVCLSIFVFIFSVSLWSQAIAQSKCDDVVGGLVGSNLASTIGTGDTSGEIRVESPGAPRLPVPSLFQNVNRSLTWLDRDGQSKRRTVLLVHALNELPVDRRATVYLGISNIFAGADSQAFNAKVSFTLAQNFLAGDHTDQREVRWLAKGPTANSILIEVTGGAHAVAGLITAFKIQSENVPPKVLQERVRDIPPVVFFAEFRNPLTLNSIHALGIRKNLRSAHPGAEPWPEILPFQGPRVLNFNKIYEVKTAYTYLRLQGWDDFKIPAMRTVELFALAAPLSELAQQYAKMLSIDVQVLEPFPRARLDLLRISGSREKILEFLEGWEVGPEGLHWLDFSYLNSGTIQLLSKLAKSQWSDQEAAPAKPEE